MWMKTGRNLEAQTQKWMSESVQNIHTQFFVIAIKHSIWTCFQNTGRRLACSTHHKSLESETPRFPLRLTSPSTVVAGITPSPSLRRTILTPSSCRYDLSKRNHCQTQICNREEAVTTRSNTCYLLTFGIFQPQARGQERPDGNATLVGEWVKMPGITKHLKCIGTMRSTWVLLETWELTNCFVSQRVTDKGRPVLLGNMSFTWRAPTIDFGPIT